MLGNAAHEQPAQTGATVTPDDDNVCSDLSRQINDDDSRLAFDEARLYHYVLDSGGDSLKLHF